MEPSIPGHGKREYPLSSCTAFALPLQLPLPQPTIFLTFTFLIFSPFYCGKSEMCRVQLLPRVKPRQLLNKVLSWLPKWNKTDFKLRKGSPLHLCPREVKWCELGSTHAHINLLSLDMGILGSDIAVHDCSWEPNQAETMFSFYIIMKYKKNISSDLLYTYLVDFSKWFF